MVEEMQIESVEATTHKVPVEIPLLNKNRERRIVFVEVETDSGITGYGFTAKPQWFGVREFINREMEPLLQGKNPLRVEQIGESLQKQLNRRNQTGVWSAAYSAIDIALWDIVGKRFEKPVWKLLGGARKRPPAYITFGLKQFNKEQLVELAEEFTDNGHNRLKMKVGINDASDIQEDEARVSAVREAVGEDVELMVDANCEFPYPLALQLCNKLEKYDISWFEEPMQTGNDPKLLSELKQRTSIPIAAGQEEGNLLRHRELITNGSIDICQPNVCFVGGYTEAKKAAGMAEAFNLKLANGCGWPHHNMHLHAGARNGWRVEFHYIHWKLGEKIYQNPPTPSEGKIELPDTPGLGLEPNHEVLERYRVQ